jgi:hypothetical protein
MGLFFMVRIFATPAPSFLASESPPLVVRLLFIVMVVFVTLLSFMHIFKGGVDYFEGGA